MLSQCRRRVSTLSKPTGRGKLCAGVPLRQFPSHRDAALFDGFSFSNSPCSWASQIGGVQLNRMSTDSGAESSQSSYLGFLHTRAMVLC